MKLLVRVTETVAHVVQIEWRSEVWRRRMERGLKELDASVKPNDRRRGREREEAIGQMTGRWS